MFNFTLTPIYPKFFLDAVNAVWDDFSVDENYKVKGRMYSIPALNSKYGQVVDELNRLGKTLDFTAFDLVRLKKDAKNIKENVDLASGFALLGMIFCLERDEKGVRKSFEKAIQQSGGQTPHIINYAIALRSLGFMEEAYGYSVDACEKDPINTDFITCAIELACVLNDKANFNKYISMWHKLKKEKHLLELKPFFREVDSREYFDFMRRHSEPNYTLPPGHLYPEKIFAECGLEIGRIFGTPLNIISEIMLDPGSSPNLVAWIEWFGDFDEGMRLYDQFEQWYIDHDYDLKTDIVSFNIEFVEGAHAGQTRFPIIMPMKIRSLPSRKYKLKAPIDIILEKYADEVLALFPKLTLCGEGGNESEAISDLKADILDLLDDLEDISEANLGATPKLWKQSLDSMVEVCR